MDFSRADFLCGTGQKAFIAELMPKHPILYPLLSQEAQDVIGQVHPQTAPARAVLEKEGFRYRNYIDIFDGGPTLECDIDRVRAIRKSRLVEVAEGQPAQGDFPACLVANENFCFASAAKSVRRFTAQYGNVRTDDAPGHGLSHRARGADRTLNVFDARQTRDGGDHHQRKPEYRVIVPDFSGNTRQRSGNNPAHANGICIESCG